MNFQVAAKHDHITWTTLTSLFFTISKEWQK